MSYLVLARKWRPRSFADTVGQAHVLKALVNALESGRLHHAYLFAGTRGVGKTTIARILAKALNCEQGVSAEPCGECTACVEIDDGRFVDLIEVDAASKTKVDDTRELLDNVQYSPARGRFKVYLIDEVHMLSKSSFNALLKTLEEPPPHVKFLLATTDPQKLPVTVLSRCLQFNLSRLPPRQIAERLDDICTAENIEREPAALHLIARAADGSLRDALSLLDQAIAYCGGAVIQDSVAQMLGTIDRDYVTRLLRLLTADDAGGVIAALGDIDQHFPDYGNLLDDLARLLQRVALRQVVGDSDFDDEFDAASLDEFADSLSAADVQLFYQIAIIGRRDLHLAPDPRSGAEMTLLRMLAFRPASAAVASDSGPARPTRRSTGASPRKSGKTEATAAAGSTSGAGWQDPDWAALIPALDLKGAVRMLAINCAYLHRQGTTIYFRADRKAESVFTPERRNALSDALSKHFGEALTVNIAFEEPVAVVAETPVEEASRKTDERYAAARAAIEADPTVRTLKDLFGAEINTDSIEPINSPGSD